MDSLDGYALERWEVHHSREARRQQLTCKTDDLVLHGFIWNRTVPCEAVRGRAIPAREERPHGEGSVSHVLHCICEATFIASSGALQITSAGFQFLLHPPHVQLWELLLQYLQMAEVSHHQRIQNFV